MLEVQNASFRLWVTCHQGCLAAAVLLEAPQHEHNRLGMCVGMVIHLSVVLRDWRGQHRPAAHVTQHIVQDVCSCGYPRRLLPELSM